MKKIIISGIVAASAMAFAGCSEMKETNSNKAVVVNNNANVTTVMNTNTMNSNMAMNSNMSGSTMSNRELTREEYDKDKDKYSAEAKASGRKIGTGAEDAWLWTKTRAALTTTNDLRDSTINVDVDNAVVTLTGTVGTKEQMQAAVKVAQEIKDVKSVKNDLKVQPNDSLTNQSTSANGNMKSGKQ